jgi:gliding motility-associated-like protein
LNLYIGSLGCRKLVGANDLKESHSFCYGSSVDVDPSSVRKHEYNRPVTISDLLLTNSVDPDNWVQQDHSWVNIEVFSDRDCKNKIGNGDKEVDLEPASGSYDTLFYVIINKDAQNVYFDSIRIRVYPQSVLDIFYSPEIRDRSGKEYNMDDQIKIKVDTSVYKFNYYTFLLNNKDLNKYYLGGDTTKSEIVLSAMAFSGVEDFMTVLATDKNNCIVRKEEEVMVNVPFPTVFTPDGDGINDVFLGGEKFRNREFHLEVSNRWGSRLYFGESGWDGTYRGNKVSPGTYLYVLKIKMTDGSTKTVKGTVTLIRKGR